MFDFKDSYRIPALSLSDKSGIIFCLNNPSLFSPGKNIPISTLAIRLSPPQLWQKIGEGDTDYKQIPFGSIISPQVFLPIYLSDNTTVKILLDTDSTIPVTLNEGSTVNISLGV